MKTQNELANTYSLKCSSFFLLKWVKVFVAVGRVVLLLHMSIWLDVINENGQTQFIKMVINFNRE